MLSSSLLLSMFIAGITAVPALSQGCTNTRTITSTFTKVVTVNVAAASNSRAASVAPPVSQAASSQPSARSSATPSTGTGTGTSADHPTGSQQANLQSGAGYIAAMLYHHNAARHNHNSPNLTWDASSATNALGTAQKCVFAHSIPQGSNQGQNIFATSGTQFQATYAVTESWYKGEFNAMLPYYGQPNIPSAVFGSVGHLTALIWNATTGVGCASVDCGTSMKDSNGNSIPYSKFTVCNYYPAGNIGGQYAAHVPPPISTTNLGNWYD